MTDGNLKILVVRYSGGRLYVGYYSVLLPIIVIHLCTSDFCITSQCQDTKKYQSCHVYAFISFV